jgi:hypothetical protein
MTDRRGGPSAAPGSVGKTAMVITGSGVVHLASATALER